MIENLDEKIKNCKADATKCILLMHKMGCLDEERTSRLLLEYTHINCRDNGGPFPRGQWVVFIGDGGEHKPPHIHIHNIKYNFTCRFDINTCKTIYEDGLTDEAEIKKVRERYTTNYQMMRGFSFEEISQRLKDWYKLPTTNVKYKEGTSNYQSVLYEWNGPYGESVCECPYIKELDAPKITPKSNMELKQLILNRINVEGVYCDLNDIDVSQVKDMGALFYGMDFNGDISQWDVSNVMNMQVMFYGSTFNQDISNWKINPKCLTQNIFDNCPIIDEFKPKVS